MLCYISRQRRSLPTRMRSIIPMYSSLPMGISPGFSSRDGVISLSKRDTTFLLMPEG